MTLRFRNLDFDATGSSRGQPGPLHRDSPIYENAKIAPTTDVLGRLGHVTEVACGLPPKTPDHVYP